MTKRGAMDVEQPLFPEAGVAKQGLGAVMGVFVPCMLSIIGVILFLRLGWAIGEAGVLGVLSMFGFGTVLIVLTDLSLCALATNGKIRAGGTYYLISRSLGPEFGGAIGIIFFAANAVGIAFYMQGFSDTVFDLLTSGDSPLVDIGPLSSEARWLKLGLGFTCISVEAVIAVVGSGIYSKVAFLIFAVQMISIYFGVFSIFARGNDPFSWQSDNTPDGHNGTFSYDGPSMKLLQENLYPKYSPGISYRVVFKTVFPALTGIMAGSNMSGVLRRPELSIPRGELAAIFCAMLTYLIVTLSLGCSVPRETLKNQYLILSVVTYPGTGTSVIVTIGVIASTTSSALASIQSASRVIQALALDNLIPVLKPLQCEWNGEPVAAILLSVAIAMSLLCIGSLDEIAPILTMFFLLTYATTNAACFVHRVSGHPNFRPRFRFFSWHTALLGGLICIGVMFYLEWLQSVLALTLLGCLVTYISRHAPGGEEEVPGASWGDIGQSLMFHHVRKFALRLDARRAHVKYWRPQFMMVLYGGPCGNVPALELINNMKKGGLFVIGDTVSVPRAGTIDESVFQACAVRRSLWHRFIDEAGFKAFVEVMLEQEGQPRLGVANLVNSIGIGGLKPNTLVLLFPDKNDSTNLRYAPVDHSDIQGLVGPRAADRRPSATSSPLAEFAANSVYDPRVENGCRLTCGFQKELWSAIRSPERQGQGGNIITIPDYMGILQDAISAQKHVLILRSMAELDKHAIAQRQGKFSAESQVLRAAWAAESQSVDEQLKQKLRRETLNPWVKAEPVRVDVWVMPWSTRADIMLQLQLAFMLSRDDFWTKHSYLRVCGLVGDFEQISGFGPTSTASPFQRRDTGGVTAEERYSELYEQVWRLMRIPATIEIFDVSNSSVEAAWGSQSLNSGDNVGDATNLYTVLNAVIRGQNFNTAVSILAIPELPSREETQGVASGDVTFMRGLDILTKGIGPTLLTKAQLGSDVITTDL